MKKKILISVLAILIITAGIVVYFIMNQKGEEGSKEDNYEYLLTSKSPKLEGIEIESIIEYEDHYVLGVHYPVTENEEINKVINEFVQRHINEFKEDAKEFFEGPSPPGGFSSWKYELNIDYEVNRPSKDIVCFKFDIILYTGGANVNRFIETFSFNLEIGEELILTDVFRENPDYLNVISEISEKELTEKFIDGGIVQNTSFNREWIVDGTAPIEKNFRNFSLKDNSIIFYFEKYQVVAGAFGQQQVEILFDQLRDVLNAEITKEPVEAEKPSIIEPPKIPSIDIGDSKVAALTFDDGPNPIPTSLILEELKKRNAVATFFVLGNRAQYYPELLRKIILQGNEIGNHTWSHKDLVSLSPEDIRKQIDDTQEIIETSTGVIPTLLRPPYGDIDDVVKKEVGLPIILWSVDTEDWENKDTDAIVAHIIAETDDGGIVLQHDLYLWSAEAVGPALDDLIAQGYKFVTVSQLLGFDKDFSKATPGNVFRMREQ